MLDEDTHVLQGHTPHHASICAAQSADERDVADEYMDTRVVAGKDGNKGDVTRLCDDA